MFELNTDKVIEKRFAQAGINHGSIVYARLFRTPKLAECVVLCIDFGGSDREFAIYYKNGDGKENSQMRLIQSLMMLNNIKKTTTKKLPISKYNFDSKKKEDSLETCIPEFFNLKVEVELSEDKDGRLHIAHFMKDGKSAEEILTGVKPEPRVSAKAKEKTEKTAVEYDEDIPF